MFNGDIQASLSAAAAAGQGAMHRTPGYLQGFTAAGEPCYDPAATNPVCPAPTAAGYGQSLTGYPVSVPTYGSYRLPFSTSHAAAAAVYNEQRKFDCYSKPSSSCSASISSHGNDCENVYDTTVTVVGSDQRSECRLGKS